MIKCPICNNSSRSSGVFHKLFKLELNACDTCDYHFIDCSKFTPSDIHKQQNSNSKTFGTNVKRNIEYAKEIELLSSNIKICNLLEIGTPSNYDFLKRVHDTMGNIVSLHSYDIIESDLPDYISFHNTLDELIRSDIDITMCIHTLEHIPPHELPNLVHTIKAISKSYIFEVPGCENITRVLESSGNPHYSFFTEKSISKLFNDNIEIKKVGKVIKFKKIIN